LIWQFLESVLVSWEHQSVLLREVIAALTPAPEKFYLDCTVGLGGHSEAILQYADTHVVALDQDGATLAQARLRLAPYGDRIVFQQVNFAEFDPKGQKFDGILADLGVSSPQLDQGERGFSWRFEAPLDMRMDQEGQELTAADLINTYSSEALANIFYEYGDERNSRRIARTIVERRPLTTTTQLADLVARCQRGGHQKIHPATRVFQALRIAVNREFEVLEQLLQKAPDWLQEGGVLAIISFHSSEDRRVKQQFREDARLEVLTRKPMVPTQEERKANPRARSAKLRCARRIPAAPVRSSL
jgi:16S rRNA (cytosine1402-N4)-methyltransferase